jgi:hypothetical protein
MNGVVDSGAVSELYPTNIEEFVVHLWIEERGDLLADQLPRSNDCIEPVILWVTDQSALVFGL